MFPDAFFLDTITPSVFVPGRLGPVFPTFVDLAVIPVQGVYPVSVSISTSMIFTSFMDPNAIGSTPPLPVFTGNGQASGTLEITYAAAAVPEPSSYR
jgi:hypothetical protein